VLTPDAQLLRPDFEGIMAPSHEQHILTLVGRFIKVIGSDEIAVDDRHTPKLYSRFLDGLLARHTTQTVDKQQHRAVPKIENSPPEAAMTSLPDLSMQTAQFARVTEPFNQPVTLSPSTLDDIYSQSNTGGNTITQYGMEDTIPNEDLLASMQAINNPVWWEHVMMPGFTWPDSAPVSGQAPPSLPGMGPGDQTHQVDPFAYAPHDPLMQHQQS
jgi:hypothetical protein